MRLGRFVQSALRLAVRNVGLHQSKVSSRIAQSNSQFCSMAKSTKKLINTADTCVDEHLEGFVAANPSVKLLKDCRVVVRSDFEDFRKSGKVAIISGGGSGHEPAFAGYVGEGGLTAAVAGSIFASPPPVNILAALKAVANPNGTLVVVINYTGDRLNFGIAVERARRSVAYADKIRVVTIGEDSALTSSDKSAGRRGLAGSLMALKIAGSMAESGKSIDEIVQTINDVAKNMGTIGLSLSSCSLPGGPPIFHLAPDEMELGLGVHGEPGVLRLKLLTAQETIARMLNHMTLKDSQTRLDLSTGDEVAVVLNNLGGTTTLEMNLAAKEVIQWLNSKQITVLRFYSGLVMTSLEMQGISITVLKLGPHILGYLDSPTSCSAWPSKKYSADFKGHQVDPAVDISYLSETTEAQKTEIRQPLSKSQWNLLVSCISAACRSVAENECLLNSLDQACGDGDCGGTMRRGAEALLKAIASESRDSCDLSSLFDRLSLVFENSTGGTTGAIYSLFLSGAAKSLESTMGLSAWITAIRDGTQNIMKYSRAAPGDRTLVDPLAAAVSVLTAHLQEADSLKDYSTLLEEAVVAAEKTAEDTAGMNATVGRASYVAKANLTQPDPGAKAVGIWMRAALEAFKKG